MEREVINPAALPAVNSTDSQAIKANGFVFVAAEIGTVPSTGKFISDDIADQARQALDNTAAILEAAGSSLRKVVQSSLYLTEFEELARVNTVYADYFPEGGPAKMACGVSKLYGGAKVEVVVIALA